MERGNHLSRMNTEFHLFENCILSWDPRSHSKIHPSTLLPHFTDFLGVQPSIHCYGLFVSPPPILILHTKALTCNVKGFGGGIFGR